MNTPETSLPFSAAPMDWTQPVECRFHQLRDVLAAAHRAGFDAVRMAIVGSGYRLTFQRQPIAQDAPGRIFIRGEGQDSGYPNKTPA